MRSYVGELESHGLLLLSSFNTLSPQKEHDDGHHRHARVKQEMARTPTGGGSPVLESATAGLPDAQSAGRSGCLPQRGQHR